MMKEGTRSEKSQRQQERHEKQSQTDNLIEHDSSDKMKCDNEKEKIFQNKKIQKEMENVEI